MAVTVLLLAAGILLSSPRNPVWKDNETIFRQLVADAPESWRAHMTLGDMLVSQNKAEGIFEMSLGARLSPTSKQVRYLTANRFHSVGQHDAAIPLYREALDIDPMNSLVREAAVQCLIDAGKRAEARAMAIEGLKLRPADRRLQRALAFADLP